jgi:regulator of replication initiation timing
MKVNEFLSGVSTPQLLAIRKILDVGATASAEDNKVDNTLAQKGQLCHKSPPKGYPKEKSEYGDPACYRYPLNTKARCLAAWRYMHQKDNWAILGDKAKTIEGHIKSYAKKHYNLDLQTGESEVFNWEQAFVEYYDGETMGERCDLIVLEPEASEENKEVKIMEDKEKIASLETDIKGKTAELEAKSGQVETLTKENTSLKTELESLRKFKTDTEQAAERAKKIQLVKSKLEEAGIEADVNAEADYWLGMSDDVLTKTIAKIKT